VYTSGPLSPKRYRALPRSQPHRQPPLDQLPRRIIIHQHSPCQDSVNPGASSRRYRLEEVAKLSLLPLDSTRLEPSLLPRRQTLDNITTDKGHLLAGQLSAPVIFT